MAGQNRALLTENAIAQLNFSRHNTVPCVFLSHKSEDKDWVRTIGEYITKVYEFDIYLDEQDEKLQKATQTGDSAAVTACIQKGIDYSTHLLCFVSEKTKESWWVPYEIGYATASPKKLPVATLRSARKIYLPDYLNITDVIRGKQELDKYLSKMSTTSQVALNRQRDYALMTESKKLSYSDAMLNLAP
jgi:hypothetical protein